ncbi:MAG: hypothetical protein AAF573_00305, partial [Bacteroidota bacterium]
MRNHMPLRLLTSFFVCLFCISSVFSQTQKEPKFGKIKVAQLEKKQDEEFPDAHAIVLFDYGVTYFRFQPVSGGLRVNFERHVAIQFFDNTEFDLATFEIPLSHDGTTQEHLMKIKGYTYNLVNGKSDRTKLSKKDI